MFEVSSTLAKDAPGAAGTAGLRYVSDDTDGMTRQGGPGRVCPLFGTENYVSIGQKAARAAQGRILAVHI